MTYYLEKLMALSLKNAGFSNKQMGAQECLVRKVRLFTRSG
jgi:hypothetical protein